MQLKRFADGDFFLYETLTTSVCQTFYETYKQLEK